METVVLPGALGLSFFLLFLREWRLVTIGFWPLSYVTSLVSRDEWTFQTSPFWEPLKVPFLLTREQFEQNLLEYYITNILVLHHTWSKLDKIYKNLWGERTVQAGKDFVCAFTCTQTQCHHVSLVSLGNWSKNIQYKHSLFCFLTLRLFQLLNLKMIPFEMWPSRTSSVSCVFIRALFSISCHDL